MNKPTIQPVFYDPKQRRRPVAVLIAMALGALATVFCISLVITPLLPVIHLPKPRFAENLDLSNPALTRREVAERHVVLRRAKGELDRLAREKRAGKEPVGRNGRMGERANGSCNSPTLPFYLS